uniref:BPTI/Kunitz inhibitor domain-containing protein n=1 Tax=Syphacia muris TaxID=451379 RepID=A0A158R459_9BILA
MLTALLHLNVATALVIPDANSVKEALARTSNALRINELLLITPFFSTVQKQTELVDNCYVGAFCKNCLKPPVEGDGCESAIKYLPILYCDEQTGVLLSNYSSYLLCNSYGRLQLAHCAPKTYFQEDQGCITPPRKLQRQNAVTGSGRVGDVCAFNTDCLSGMYCSGGLCTCLSTYILREGYCYEKINPNQPGCTYDIQCSAVWPGARCVTENGIGTCHCQGMANISKIFTESQVARETRDGWICLSMRDYSSGSTSPLYFVCPLPEGAGFKMALNDPKIGPYPISCTVGSSSTSENSIGKYGSSSCIWPSTGEYIGDIYDCIATSPHINLAEKFPESNFAPTADGVCCPNRAFTCIQPQVTGPNPTESRWWYNSITGTCQQFLWDPLATQSRYHSPNNFQTIGHCESYCRDTCNRGSPQYRIEEKLQAERPLTRCSVSSGCANDYQCTSVGSLHLCCPTPGIVCGPLGGRPFDLHPRSLNNTILDFTTTLQLENVQILFIWVLVETTITFCPSMNAKCFAEDGSCLNQGFSVQCERGSPLKIGEESQRCQNNAGCPSTHECKTDQGVCCPRKQTVCSQPLRIGDCTENVKRYWYNANTRQCQMFEFSGCQGNDNNFETILDCQSYCKNAIPEPRCAQGQAFRDSSGNFVQCGHTSSCPPNYECYFDGTLYGCCPTKAYTCSLNSDSGVQCGAGTSFKYFYNVQTQTCENFQFNGCDGNSNNFPTRSACEQYCGVGGCPNGGAPLRDHTGQISSCNPEEGCADTHECVPVFIKGGLIHRCCPTKKYICSLPPIQGTMCGTQALNRYYFNIVTGQCTSFQYNGCEGNQNNFISYSQCNNFCMSNACPAGDSVYLDPNNHQPVTCNEALQNSCPTNYECTFNSLVNKYVCCGAGSMGVCPNGEKAYMNTYDSTARECLINVEGSCPDNYLCRFNMQKNRYYCCASVEGKTCPAGKFLYKDLRTNLPIKCTIGSKISQCPDGYSCQSYIPDAFQGFCCATNNVCPDNSEFLIDELSQQPRICTLGDFVSCPNGYVCRTPLHSVEGFCCKGGFYRVTGGCPPGNFAYIKDDEVASCDPFDPPNASCPTGYSCQWSVANQRYQCCGTTELPIVLPKDDGCSTGQIAFMDGNSPKVCTAGDDSCPVGYFCQFSSKNDQFQCCGVSGGCPNNQVAFVGIEGSPQHCIIGQSACPVGFACQKTDFDEEICCSLEEQEEETTTVKNEKCGENKVRVNGLCMKRVEIGGFCLDNAQCTGGSVCKRRTCTCPSGYVVKDEYCQSNTPRCSIREIQINDGCYQRVPLGAKCQFSRQCPLTSYCISQHCQCMTGFAPEGEICVEQEDRESVTDTPKTTTAKPEDIGKCSNPRLRPYRDGKSKKILSCSPINDRCPSGFACMLDSTKLRYICCGIATVAPISSVCPSNRTPYLLNGHPQVCVKAKCPQGYDCVYSGLTYYCCSSGDNFASETAVYENSSGCPRGRPLMFPATRTPVSCSGRRTCTLGYYCVRSTKYQQHICCSDFAFDEPLTIAVNGDGRIKKQTGSGRVGDACAFNTDCLTGMFCNSGLCSCLTTYIAAESYCYQKIDPGQPGCVYNEQCNAVWPEAFCDTSAGVGTCKCGDKKVERSTRDGHVCLDVNDANENTLAITCPLPEGAGYTSALSDPNHPRQNDGPGPVLCNSESTVTSQTVGSEEIGDGSAACLFPSDNSYLADIYDCVQFVSVMDLTSAGYSSKADGICCPNRAFTCIQPTATGPNPTEPRWWYNSVTGMCQQFLWDPVASGSGEHSPNNFRTIEHCESYCRDTCSRGAPEYDVRNTILEEKPITGCSQATTCGNHFECKTVGSVQWCCPSVAAICGIVGGRPADPSVHTRQTIFHSGVQKQGTAPSTRFFYDPVQGKCSAFTYNGAGGNYNNFMSRIDCELFCSRRTKDWSKKIFLVQCDRGNPLRIGEVTQNCQSNNDCPSSHECKIDQGVCCPRMQTICTQPLRVGNCDRSVRRYWYNAQTRECQAFDYTGCQGNDNNFDTLMDCQTFCRNAAPEPRCPQGQPYKDNNGKAVTCSSSRSKSTCPANYECYFDGYMFGCCPNKAYTCSLPSHSGVTCGPGVSYKYYYNSQTQECETFEFLGCDGNSNNFATRGECESFCGVGGCVNGGSPLRDNNGVLVSCTDKDESCPSTHECQAVMIGNQPSSRCCPSRAYICGLPPQQGSSLCSGGLTVVTRYYFNIVTRKCSSFVYNGCDGNPNNFGSLNQCNNFCHAAACSAGDIVYLNPNTQQPITCNDEMQNNCPRNFQCTFDSLTEQNVCCGATDMGVCPEGEKAYINAMDMTVRECLINEQHSCPSDYLCRFNPQKNRYFCCSSVAKTKQLIVVSIIKGYCPIGRAPYKDQISLQPARCTMNTIANTCPDGYSCQSELNGALQGYCCSVNDICPNKEEYFVDENSAMPRACTIGQFVTCPSGYSCQAVHDGMLGYCCKGTAVATASDGCPPGEIVYMDRNEILACDPFNPLNQACPTGFSCQWSLRTQRYQCCGADPQPAPLESYVIYDGCPSRQVAYNDPKTKKPKVCTSASFSCPVGYFCQFSTVNKQFQCCGIPSDCPNNQVAFIGLSGDPQSCSMANGPPCPPGYSCVRGKTSGELCCAGKSPCPPSQVLIGRDCYDGVSIDSPCVDTLQCLGDAICIESVCTCPSGTRKIGDKCEKPSYLRCAKGEIKVENQCLQLIPIGRECISSQQCQGGATCQHGYCKCPRETIHQNNQCVPKTTAIAAITMDRQQFNNNIAKTSNAQETLTTADEYATLSMVSTTNRPSISTVSLKGICPSGRKYILWKSMPRTCTHQACPRNYQCIYNKALRNYYCCSSSTVASRTTIPMAECPSGNTLLYPATGQPVVCAARKRCPTGYTCILNVATKSRECCKSPRKLTHSVNSYKKYQKKINAKQVLSKYNTYKKLNARPTKLQNSGNGLRNVQCPSYLVLLEMEVNGKIIKRCQPSCPSTMTPINGICRLVRRP